MPPLIAIAFECAGLVLIRGPRGVIRSRPWPQAGWALILIGIYLWCRHSPYGAGLSWALLVLSCGGLLLAALGSLTTPETKPARNLPSGAPRKQASRWWRISLPRLLGSLLASPVCGIAAGLLGHAAVPGDGSTKLAAFSLCFLFAFALAMIWAISCARAWRGLAWLLALDAATAACLAFYLPVR